MAEKRAGGGAGQRSGTPRTRQTRQGSSKTGTRKRTQSRRPKEREALEQPPELRPEPEERAVARATTEEVPRNDRADFGQRLGAYLVDWLIFVVPGFVLMVILPVALVQVVFLIAAAGYYAYFEGGPSGQTIGKKLVGIRVVDAKTGGPIDPVRALIRLGGRFLSGMAWLLGYLWMLWDPKKETWHDKISTTAVVPLAGYPVESM